MNLIPKQLDKPNSKSIVPYWDIKNIRLYLLKTFRMKDSEITINKNSNMLYKQYVVSLKNDYIIIEPNDGTKANKVYNNYIAMGPLIHYLKLS